MKTEERIDSAGNVWTEEGAYLVCRLRNPVPYTIPGSSQAPLETSRASSDEAIRQPAKAAQPQIPDVLDLYSERVNPSSPEHQGETDNQDPDPIIDLYSERMRKHKRR